jgi:hypothetical protein
VEKAQGTFCGSLVPLALLSLAMGTRTIEGKFGADWKLELTIVKLETSRKESLENQISPLKL